MCYSGGMSELIYELRELHKHWDKDPEFMYTARKCNEAADEIGRLKKLESTWPSGYIEAILSLLDRIDIDDDASLAKERFDIAEQYGLTVNFGIVASNDCH